MTSQGRNKHKPTGRRKEEGSSERRGSERIYLEPWKPFDSHLLTDVGTAAIFVDGNYEITHTSGNASLYLKLASGRASLNLLKMVRGWLFSDIRKALEEADSEKVSVRKKNVHASRERDLTLNVDLEVIPLYTGKDKELCFMVLFQNSSEEPGPSGSTPTSGRRKKKNKAAQIVRLERELLATKSFLRSTIETQNTINEELQTANEQFRSLEVELSNENLKLMRSNEELESVLSLMDVAVVLVGKDLTIRRFTPPAAKLFGLIAGDLGRSLLNINLGGLIPDYREVILQVMASARATDKVLDRGGAQHLLRIIPYQSLQGNIHGALMTLVDISSILRDARAAQTGGAAKPASAGA